MVTVSTTATRNPIVVVMGVAGSGKSSIGQAIADRASARFLEGDDLHPQANIDLMTRGIPLDDAHRKGWLDRLAAAISSAPEDEPLVVTCSALKRSYREQLAAASPRVVFLHLAGERGLIEERMAGRRDHFMPTSLLDSQFNDLEAIQPDEHAITVDVSDSADAVVDTALNQLGLAR